MPTKSFYVKDSELDEYQVQVIQRRTDRSFIVKGCAGSGKSILALWKVKQIQEESRGSYYFIVFHCCPVKLENIFHNQLSA